MRQPAKTGNKWFLVLVGLTLTPISTSAEASGSSKLFWPTDAGRCITSTFCEFRPGHFHSGIDISTWGKPGYKCFAVDDGEVVRAKVSCGGYGRALYLRLADGRYAVYAHLSRFTGALADTVVAIQEEARNAYFDRDFAPGTFPVRRGDLIAFTGQSGVGVPHLHLEIRDRHERPEDPLRAGLAVEDRTPPEINRVVLTPLTMVSSVDGRSDSVILDVHPEGRAGQGRIPRVIPVEGEIGISLEIFETTDACRYRLAPHRLELREGDELLYSIEYDRFAFSQTGRMDLQIDPRFSYSRVGRFHHLWRRPGYDLPFSRETPDRDGVLEGGQLLPEDRALRLEEGGDFPLRDSVQEPGETVRELTLVAIDAAGNSGQATLRLSFAPPPTLSVLSATLSRFAAALESNHAELEESWADTLEVVGAVRAEGRPLDDVDLEFSFDHGQTWHDASSVIPDRTGMFETRIPVLRRVPGEGRGVLLRGRARDVLGASGLTRTVAVEGSPPPPPESPPFQVVTLGSWVELRFGEEVLWNAVSGGWDGAAAVLVRPWGRGVRVIREPANRGEEAREWSGLSTEWKGFDPWGRPVALRFEYPVGLTGDEENADVRGPLGLSHYRFAPRTFRERAAVQIREEPTPVAEELRPAGPLHFLDSGQVPLLSAYEVTLWPEKTVELNESRVAIFVQEPGGFRYLGGEPDRASGGWSTRTRTPLPIALMEDLAPPAIGDPRLEELRGRICLKFLADDRGSGIDCGDVEVYLDGVPVLHEFDEETGEASAFPHLSSEPGAGGVFELRATDRCGNSSRREVTVRLP